MRDAEHNQIRPPLGRVGDNRLGSLIDEGVANLSRGSDAQHAKLEDSRLDDVRGGGVRLERIAAASHALAKIEVQDAGLARTRSARQLRHIFDLACILACYET